MCGIAGYLGPRKAVDVVFDQLKRLEYRGYDSAGIAFPERQDIRILKKAGKLSELGRLLEDAETSDVRTAMGHSRWATHGAPTDTNAHPHFDQTENVSIIHNGIIENYLELREELAAKGHHFHSQTDTEVAAHVIGDEYAKGVPLEEAVRLAVKRLRGAYALVVMSRTEPGKLVATRNASPLILGFGEHENMLASDIPALLPYTREVMVLEEGDIAVLTDHSVRIMDGDSREVPIKAMTIEWDIAAAERGGYEHFMLKEIHEQPEAVEQTLRGRIRDGAVDLSELGLSKERLKRIKRVQIIACGTSYHAGLILKYAMQEFAGLPVEATVASEYRYSNPPVDKGVLAIAISQSGETADTKAAADLAREGGATVVSVCNVVGSSIPRMSHATLYTRAGIEIGVASTKAYTTQMTALLLFCIWFARARGAMAPKQEKELVAELESVPALMRKLLESNLVGVKRCAARYQNVHNFMYIGRRYNYATAFEGALKLKEISYIHAEGYGAGEMKHGPIALVEGSFPTIVICPASPYYDKSISNIREIKARDGVIVAVASEGDEDIKDLADYLIYVPKTSEPVSPLLTVLPLQLLAYYTAINRGCDPDKPRNLAKAVTVE